MSLWRKEASARLPELQPIIASRQVDNPMMLWIELQIKFQTLCQQESPPLDLLRRIWQYAKWCMQQENGDVATAAALGFCEHLLDNEAMRHLLPLIMARHEFESLRDLLRYHNSEENYAEGLKLFGTGNSK